MSNYPASGKGVPGIGGKALHYVLQRPDVRAVFDEMMRLQLELPHATGDGKRYGELHDRLQVVSAEWFRLSREAAEGLPPEQRS